jgi:carbamoyltransferase
VRTVLGLSAFYHDAAAALLVDGRIVAAAQEERFSRIKHDAAFPAEAVAWCLKEAGLKVEDLDLVAYYEKPLLKLDRLLETYLATAPMSWRSFLRSMPLWLKKKAHIGRELARAVGPGYTRRFVFPEHHLAHAASAFLPSPFEEAAILTLDGVGEWATATVGHGRGNQVRLLEELRFPHSLGLLYSAFTVLAGFEVNDGEYKLMGLAPYGTPRFKELILERLIDVKSDGSFRLDMRWFGYAGGLTTTTPRLHRLLGCAPRRADEPLSALHMDLAASIQAVTEEVMLRAARHALAKTGAKRLCLAGGVALNCVGNGRILREAGVEDLWIQPAAGDAGGALGAALWTWHGLLGKPRSVQTGDAQRGSRLGPRFTPHEARAVLDAAGATYEHLPDEAARCSRVAALLAEGKVVGWFEGAMEYGPRALGGRSILADPRRPEMQSRVNQMVKLRESFRPFAPAVLAERADAWFDLGGRASPYMLLVAPVAAGQRLAPAEPERALSGLERLGARRSTIPAVTHVDGSARVQTVDRERSPRFHALLSAFEAQTGCPVLVNTSFNVKDEPIVATPQDAWRTFLATASTCWRSRTASSR